VTDVNIEEKTTGSCDASLTAHLGTFSLHHHTFATDVGCGLVIDTANVLYFKAVWIIVKFISTVVAMTFMCIK